MRQPELGIKINEIRNQKSITQKELSEYCNIDIRTIQRIETGDVTPRISTLKLIAKSLSCEVSTFNSENHKIGNFLSPQFLLFYFVIGVFYFISWILFSPFFPKNILLPALKLFIGIVYTITGVLFYYGFYNLGKMQKNNFLKISSIAIIVCIPIFLITILLSSEYAYVIHMNKLIVIFLSVNSIFFGMGLIRNNSQFLNIYKITGVLQIVIAPFFILPLPGLNIVGFWLSVPFILLLLSIVFLEFKESKKLHLSKAGA